MKFKSSLTDFLCVKAELYKMIYQGWSIRQFWIYDARMVR